MSDLPFKIPESKTEVLEMVQSYRADLSALWNNLSDDKMLQIPGPQEDWSVKDLIAHITWWETFTMSRILLIIAGETAAKIENYDAINAQVYQAHKALPLPQVLADFKTSLPRVLATIDMLSWAEINGELRYHDDSLGRLIGGNTFGHYLEHLDDLKQFVSSL